MITSSVPVCLLVSDFSFGDWSPSSIRYIPVGPQAYGCPVQYTDSPLQALVPPLVHSLSGLQAYDGPVP